jgi:phenylpropionate dioxygenase-like ring-hydroxylating dioxygenase large terminal subunit
MPLMSDASVVERIFEHIEQATTDLCAETWREPVAHYRSDERLALERERVLRRWPVPFCPSAALPDVGSYVAREAAGTPLLAVRGKDGRARVFRNACRHRGTLVASGCGSARTFSCPYHGWTYGLDGALDHVPHEYGFPGLDRSRRGLVPVDTVERHGLVFACQDAVHGAAFADTLEALESPLVDTGYRLSERGSGVREVEANWKILVEGFLEGYHIRATHQETFYPVQFDNLNVVETFGWNSRIAYPYRAVNKLRGVAPAERAAEGVLTYLYHFFPNVVAATFIGRIVVIAVEPLTPERSLLVTYTLSNRAQDDAAQALLQRGGELVNLGAAEDRAMACSVQRGLASGANEFLEFGRFEGAIGHFHRSLHAAIGRPDCRPS